MRGAVAIVGILAGCSFSHGSLSTDDSSTTPGDGRRDGTTTIDAPALVDNGLLVRYVIDEAASGQQPLALVDSAPNPLPLTMQYTNALAFAQPSTRALHWTTPGDDARASAPITGTKILTQLDPSTTFTLEVVAALQNVSSGECRLLSIANGTGTYGSVALITSDLVTLRLHFSSTYSVTWSVPWNQGKLVIHVVVDTNQTTATDRTTLYVNGVPATRTGGTSPTMSYTPPLLTTDYLAVGNVEGAGRSPGGDIFYAAIYTTAFTPQQVANNAALLATNDDL